MLTRPLAAYRVAHRHPGDSRSEYRKPEAISRLLRGEGSNPTLETLIDLVDAIGLELDVRIKRQPAKRVGEYSPLNIHTTL